LTVNKTGKQNKEIINVWMKATKVYEEI